MQKLYPYVLSIAGFDPSAGAGILADIKTFEANESYGMGVCTALTYQNHKEFIELEWISSKKILKQIDILFRRTMFNVVKIGLIKNIAILKEIMDHLLHNNSNIKVIWDPVFKASAGYVFHKSIQLNSIKNILNKLYLLTPNLDEAGIIFGKLNDSFNIITDLLKTKSICPVLLKGGHSKTST